MAYANTLRSRNRTATSALVIGIHAALGYALVVGLGVTFIPKERERFVAVPIPSPKPSEKPKKPPENKADPIETHITTVPPLVPIPMPTFAVEPQPIPTAEPTQVAVVTFPTPTPRPSPSPSPRFTPKRAEPIGRPASWVSPSDYPQRDLRDGNQGVTSFRLSIGTDGRVTGCTVTGSSGFASLDAAACNKLTARGKFRPATGEDGEKVAGSYASSIKWEIPQD